MVIMGSKFNNVKPFWVGYVGAFWRLPDGSEVFHRDDNGIGGLIFMKDLSLQERCNLIRYADEALGFHLKT